MTNNTYDDQWCDYCKDFAETDTKTMRFNNRIHTLCNFHFGKTFQRLRKDGYLFTYEDDLKILVADKPE